MAPAETGFLELTSNVLRRGIHFHSQNHDLSDHDELEPTLEDDESEYEDLPDKTDVFIGLGLQSVSIILGGHTYMFDPESQFDHVQHHVDPALPVRIQASLTAGDSPQEEFQELYRFITLLGTEKFRGYWNELTLSLPSMELPFDRIATPSLPFDVLTNLRHLNWSGHPAQLRASWFPFTPALLQSVETLAITCDIAPDDCTSLLYQCCSSRLKSLSIKTIRPMIIVDSSIRDVDFSSKGISIPLLETLDLESYDDIYPLLRPFEFPSLLTIQFSLRYKTHRSSLPDLDNVWGRATQVVIFSDLSDEDRKRIRTQCDRETQFEFHRVWKIVYWHPYTTLSHDFDVY
ncbi:hypothetical protein DXG01_010955 [Tephrocybe rancida]|nr:hypothetical protein DXG01_010955 [Tephrocybe rancida]